MFCWCVRHIRSHWNFSLKKHRKITHLLVQLIQISVPETPQAGWAESSFYYKASKLLQYLFWPRFKKSLTISQVKTLLGITTRKSHILSLNPWTFPSFFCFFFLSFFHLSPTSFLSSSLFTCCQSVCVLCNYEGRLTRWGRQVQFSARRFFAKAGPACTEREGVLSGNAWQPKEPRRTQILQDKRSDKKQVMAGIFNWLLRL